MTFFAPAVGALWQLLESYNLEAETIFHGAGIDPECLYDPGARIPIQAMEQLVKDAYRLACDPDFALREAGFFRPAHLGALGFAWLASSSLRVAHERMARFSRMINDDLTIELVDSAQQSTVRFSNQQPSHNDALREQAQLAISVKCCRVIAGEKFSPLKASFSHPAPANTTAWFAYFRCPLEFNSNCTALHIRREDMDRRLTGSNEQLAQMNEHIVVKYLAHLKKNDIVNRCKAAIIDSLGSGGVTENQVAESMHMTTRNLHRKLQKENTSFKHLLNEVRQDLALQYIKDRSMTLTEISFMLGFSEVSSFSRAFKNWTGKPPSELRQQA